MRCWSSTYRTNSPVCHPVAGCLVRAWQEGERAVWGAGHQTARQPQTWPGGKWCTGAHPLAGTLCCGTRTPGCWYASHLKRTRLFHISFTVWSMDQWYFEPWWPWELPPITVLHYYYYLTDWQKKPPTDAAFLKTAQLNGPNQIISLWPIPNRGNSSSYYFIRCLQPCQMWQNLRYSELHLHINADYPQWCWDFHT